MKKIILGIGVTVCALSFLLRAEETKKRPMTVDDGLNMVSVGSALMSPDGKSVFYSLSELDWAKNKRKSTYCMISANGGDAYPYIGEAGGSSFQFSPDGKFLSFTRPVEQKAQIFLLPTGGGEAVQLTNHDNAVGPFRWSQDSTMILFLAQEPRSKDDEKKYKAGDDAVLIDEGPNGQTEGNWNALWQFDVKAKKETKLTNEKLVIGGFDLSPDGTRILYTARFENRRNQGYLSEIYLFNIKDKTNTRLTDNKAPEGGLLWAPDGKSFAYSAPDDKVWELRNSKIWVMNRDKTVPDDFRTIRRKYPGVCLDS